MKQCDKEKEEWGKITNYKTAFYGLPEACAETISFDKVKNATGYQYRGEYEGEYTIIYNIKTTTPKFRNRTNDRFPTYYCFRAYKTLNDGETIYGPWIKIKEPDWDYESKPESMYAQIEKEYINDLSGKWDS